ncbi:carbon-nitrogen hydrolase family protein [Janibacter melonis]|uniref:carbon-nitrogen hydrolase family protein n=1 Tax=Janibacter melonis TaxID=262209 RepID=UPI0020942ACF|nr:carbon-nitrogen hydrolase family protein [Janibacter melonis]
MPDPMRVAGVQLVASHDVEDNLEQVVDGVRQAAEAGARLVVFPEATMAPFSRRLDTAAQPLDGPFADGVRRAAHEHGVVAVIGLFTPADDVEVDGQVRHRVHNTLLLTGDGAEETSYRKIHLFDAFDSRESDTVAAGDAVVTAQVDGWTVGLATCFDVRFADHFTELGRRGSELVVLPASWGDGPGKADQWDLLTQARAHDAQAWLLGVGQAWTPQSGDGPFGIGRSVLADPTGAVRSRLDAAPGMLVADLDPAPVAATRRRVPIL